VIQLFNEDCMQVMARYPDKHFELAIVDPPYGIERFKKGGSHLNKYGSEDGKWNNEKPSPEYFNVLFAKAKRVIIWGGNNFDLPESEYFIVWQKSNAEGFSFAMCEMAWTNCSVPAKIYRHYHAQCSDSRIHPTQKPVELYRWLLKNYAKPGDKILDTHLGSGSIAIACNEMGFDLVGCEIDKDYFDAAQKRIDREAAQMRLC